MTEADKPRRSRTAWPGPLTVAGVGEGHTHELPKALRARYRLLLAAVIALLLAVGTLTYFVYRQEQYIAGRGEQRDRERVQLQQQITDAVCDLLDQLPEGGLLERPRAKYNCGPGTPLSEFPEDVRRRIEGQRQPPPAAPASTTPTTTPTRAPMGSAAQPTPPPPAPNPPQPRPTTGPKPTPTPTAPPGPDDVLDPVTDTVCGLLPVCTEEIP